MITPKQKNEIKQLEDKELLKKLESLSTSLVVFRHNLMLGKESNLKVGKKLRHERAYVQTVLRERQLQQGAAK